MRTNDIRTQLRDLLAQERFVVDKTGVRVVELAPAHFLADEPAIFGVPNTDYIEREIAWYDSQSLNVRDIPGGAPQIWQQVADPDGYINSNYGWCIYSSANYEQYTNVLEELRQNPNSRRAVMIYTRPTMWLDFDLNGRSDFMCTNAVQYMIRDDRLHAYVNMRSNDAVFGYKNDRAWQLEVQHRLARDLAVAVGDLWWTATSLHVYERHWELMK